ncbi:MAG: MotA/TolQ/ExbB proton channel family protein [Planctomycetota bacterium]
MEETIWSLVSRTMSAAGNVERATFCLLLVFSLASWCILLIKLEDFHRAHKNSRKFLQLFNEADSFGAILAGGNLAGKSALLIIFQAAMRSLESKRSVAQSSVVSDPRQIPVRPENTDELLRLEMQQASNAEFSRLQRGLSFLATVGSTSPFIGLFGTVWGIMNTFRSLGMAKSASLAVVAPGISSALIATAAGLVVAIPAVMAYNAFLSRLDALQDRADNFIESMVVMIRSSGYLEASAFGESRAIPPTASSSLSPAATIAAERTAATAIDQSPTVAITAKASQI